MRKSKGKSRMDNSETNYRQIRHKTKTTKHKTQHNTTQHRKLKKMSNTVVSIRNPLCYSYIYIVKSGKILAVIVLVI